MTNTLDAPAAALADLGPLVDMSASIAEPFVTAPQHIALPRADILRRLEALAYAQTPDIDRVRLLPNSNAIILVDPAAVGLVTRARATARAIELAGQIEHGHVGMPIEVYRAREGAIHAELHRAFETWATSADDDVGAEEIPEAVQSLRSSAVFLPTSILSLLRVHFGSIAARRRIFGLCRAEKELGEAVAGDYALTIEDRSGWKAERTSRIAARDRIMRRMSWPAELTEGGRYAAARRDLIGAISDLDDRPDGTVVVPAVLGHLVWLCAAAERGRVVATVTLLDAVERRGGLSVGEASRIHRHAVAMIQAISLRPIKASKELLDGIAADLDAIDDETQRRLWNLATAMGDAGCGAWRVSWERRSGARIQLSLAEPNAAYDVMTRTYEHIGHPGRTELVIYPLPDGSYRTRVDGEVQPPVLEMGDKPERKMTMRVDVPAEHVRALFERPEDDPAWVPDADDVDTDVADGATEPRPTARSVYAALRQSIVQQDDACRTAALALMSNVRGATLLVGSTGSGKTLIAETAARLTGRPFVIVDASQLVPAGIVGETISSVAERVLAAADGDADRAAEAVVVFDEINRLLANEVLEYGTIVCGQLLRILDGAPIAIEHKAKANGQTSKGGQMPTDRWTIFLAGAWTELRDQINAPTVGFTTSSTAATRRIEPTLEELGFSAEFVGRIRRSAFLRPHDAASLSEILRRPNISPWGALLPRIDASAHQFAVAEALRRGTGARGLRNVAVAVSDHLAFADDIPETAPITAAIVAAALRHP